MTLITIQNLTKTIKKKTVLSNINLEIESGKICGFVGPNGSGKTMLLRAIAGLLYLPKNCVQISSNCTKGVIIENPGFINIFSGYENLEYLASINHTITSEQIKKAMEQVNLDPNDDRKVAAYSLGMKQKLAIAQAIMEEPQLLILDEPTRGLEAESIDNVYSLLHNAQRNGSTILIASHNKGDISELCQEIYFLDEGKIVSHTC